MTRPKSLDEFDPGYNTHVTAARNALYNAAGQMTHLGMRVRSQRRND